MKFSAMRKLRYLIAAASVGLFVSASGQPNLSTPLPQDPAVLKGKFDNGLTYYVRPNSKPEKKVELRLIVNAGSILETDEQQGLAHFLEHMNFNGTKHFEKNELVAYLQSIGVEFGADLNAYTGFDQTVYILPIPSEDTAILSKGFQIIEDWAHNALLSAADIDEERGVVLEESRIGKGAEMRMLGRYFPQLVSGSRYAQRLPIGKDEILKNFSHETLRKFYRDWYRPDLQAVAVVGDIDTATAMRYLRKHFAGIPKPFNAPERFYEKVQPRTRAEAMVVTDKEASSSRLAIQFPYEAKKSFNTLGDYREYLKRNLFISLLNSRFNDLARSSSPPFPYAGAYFDDMVNGYTSFAVITAFGNEGPDKALAALTAELVRAEKFGFTKSELEIAKKQIISHTERTYNERNTTESSSYVEEYIQNYLFGYPFPGIENEFAYVNELMPGISVNEINELAKSVLRSKNTFTFITAPQNDDLKLPSDKQLQSAVKKGFSQKVTAPKEVEVAQSLMPVNPQPGKAITRVNETELGVGTYILSNGIKVSIKPTNFKSDEIILSGTKKGGSNNYGAEDKYEVHMATDIIDAMGLGPFSPTELEKMLAGKNVSLNVAIGEISNNIKGNSSVRDFETLLQLLHLQIMQPRRDDELFAAFRDQQKSMMQFLSANPQYAYYDSTYKALYNNNPLASVVVPSADAIQKIRLDRVMEIYRNEFSSADGYHFFISGNIDEATALPLIETYLGSIPSANKNPEFRDNGLRAVKGQHTISIRRGSENQSMIMALYHGEIPYSEEMELRADAVAEILNIKVIENLREKLGAIYGGGFYASVEKYPYQSFSVALMLPCGPENVEMLLNATKEQIDILKQQGPSQLDLDKVKKQWMEKHRTRVQENDYWCGKMKEILFWERNADHVLNYNQWLETLTIEDIRKAAEVLFSGENSFISVLYPEG